MPSTLLSGLFRHYKGDVRRRRMRRRRRRRRRRNRMLLACVPLPPPSPPQKENPGWMRQQKTPLCNVLCAPQLHWVSNAGKKSQAKKQISFHALRWSDLESERGTLLILPCSLPPSLPPPHPQCCWRICSQASFVCSCAVKDELQ